MNFANRDLWALILGGSSGFGLATAKHLSRAGMNICIVHRDRRGAMARIQDEFESIRTSGVNFFSYNLDALSAEGRATVLDGLSSELGAGKVKMLLHSIAFGSVKLLVRSPSSRADTGLGALALALNVPLESLTGAVNELFLAGQTNFSSIASPPAYEQDLLLDEEDVLRTVQAMGISLLSWTQDLFRREMFASDARIVGLTSEGNETAWRGYAAVSAAKAALESISRGIAKEFGPYGIRSNVVQAGVTDTPALRLIPGNERLRARAIERNPLGRLTNVDDVASVIALLAADETAWINGSLIRVDGGEKISG
jgi:NAD(P)-dependent dehydrogenase (short-subunit alcohol dehydrogenase family)